MPLTTKRLPRMIARRDDGFFHVSGMDSSVYYDEHTAREVAARLDLADTEIAKEEEEDGEGESYEDNLVDESEPDPIAS